MDMKLLQDHGRSMLKELKAMMLEPEKIELAKKPVETEKPKEKQPLADTFEKSEVKQTPEQNVAQDGKVNVSFQFDLFYQLSQKVEAKMGQKGLQKFTDVSSQVSETFMSNFSLKIDGVGSFMKSTDNALDISPDVTNKFLDSVKNLADLSPEALQDFLTESSNFFDGLKAKYGEADGTFDAIKEQMQSQAQKFFSDVGDVRNEMSKLPENDNNTSAQDSLPQSADVTEQLPQAQNPEKISFAFKPDLKISPSEYKNDFLQQFFRYTRKFNQQIISNFMNAKPLDLADISYDQPNGDNLNKTELIDTSA